MFVDMPLISDALTLQEAHQEQVVQHVLRANASHFPYDWKVNDQALKKEPLSFSDKMKPEWSGPYQVEHIHVNGMCTYG